jgi:NadR type nicotinamide-nucleotide adenylyltransferase
MTGPESSGKTTLVIHLAAHFETIWVPEYARTYLEDRNGKYQLADLEEIARSELALYLSMVEHSEGGVIFLDTWMLELEIWARLRFNEVPEIIREIREQFPPDLYLLCQPDIPWEADPLRENPHDRDQLFVQYQKAIADSGIPHARISGTRQQRLAFAVDAVENILQSH